MSAGRTRKICRILTQAGCDSVHIGGGEPFLNPDGLLEVVSAVTRSGLQLDYIETNSSWFHDSAQAVNLLRRVQAAGCRCLLLSISPYHNAYIPFEKVKGVICACRTVGISVFPWIEQFMSQIASFDTSRRHALEEYAAEFGDEYLERTRAMYGLTMGGRALATYAPRMPRLPLQAVLAERDGGCRHLADTHHFHVDPLGRYIPGLCPGLSIPIDQVGDGGGPERPALAALFHRGVRGLLAYARTQGDVTLRDEGYVSSCELCHALRTQVVEGNPQHPELQPVGFYRELAGTRS